ncbi:alpha-glucuronidase family glycosyl hydrolase [Galbibacter pacificus]|uniref:Xylan alpha-1,2-glucuronidase n=1 Tax=Galbibacter pacificus TaxID=2996052 RepID=A0ABT6FPN8_9FLAO|nr:alpha-glucuronidase family glycosyl hydrolase [Galbibacter pacificus]MDG3582297.1 alpha-glucuronidase family glycosyl hydrolase [Galbibacter pacificus]MDG3585227.1 alpha-glucuronidase family glycosyl hydrolase [Galbibacter pacificus]
MLPQTGYKLWLDYRKVKNSELLQEYRNQIQSVYIQPDTKTLEIAQKELSVGLAGLLGDKPTFLERQNIKNAIIVAKIKDLNKEYQALFESSKIEENGFQISHVKENIIVTSNDDIGVLYGVFHLLKHLQMNLPLKKLPIFDAPKIDLRILNHWDNLDRSVERGYAGNSIWKWHKLPGYIDQRYIDYARANASVGINGTVLTNVNANALILTPMYIKKVAALANVFRPYGIRVYLTARFSAPIEIGNLKTADPLNPEVRNWWKAKIDRIYKEIPDFGGFLVKANSEGQPGPQNYGRSHADGANMLADALAPHKGIVMWRAFVYSEHDATDRAKQAYNEFVPLDGKFKENVLLQVKNGAIDFQPREPFHPMFGAMPKTPLMMEFQITQEYLGFSTHLVYLPKLYEEVLQADTYQHGKGSLVAKVIDGTLDHKKISGMAGVANIGSDVNWTGHPFGQANWYGFGRLSWNPYLSAKTIANEWLRMTYSTNDEFVTPMIKMLLISRAAVVNYMTPLGLHHLMDTGHHYGPGPWVSNLSRPEWNPVYYHKADSLGIGFDRTPTGSNATAQYAKPVADTFNNLETCPEEYLLWFHHLPWDYKLKNGNILWNGLALKYQEGVGQVREMQSLWEQIKPYLSAEQYQEVAMLLSIQLKEAKWWRDACMSYFQTFSKKPFPKGMETPKHSLKYYKSLKFPYAPGIRPSWH